MAAFAPAAPSLLNTPVTANGLPVPAEAELFLMKRRNINFSVKSDEHGKLAGKGTVFVTTLRIVFVNETFVEGFSSFDVPLCAINREKFNQPIFGANNLTGQVAGPGGGTQWRFKMTFRSGGCGTFLPVFLAMMGEIRESRPDGGACGGGMYAVAALRG